MISTMTKNLSSKGHRGGNTKTGGEHHKKSAHQNSQNANQQNETTTTINSVVIAAVQKASIDLKMVCFIRTKMMCCFFFEK